MIELNWREENAEEAMDMYADMQESGFANEIAADICLDDEEGNFHFENRIRGGAKTKLEGKCEVGRHYGDIHTHPYAHQYGPFSPTDVYGGMGMVEAGRTPSVMCVIEPKEMDDGSFRLSIACDHWDITQDELEEIEREVEREKKRLSEQGEPVFVHPWGVVNRLREEGYIDTRWLYIDIPPGSSRGKVTEGEGFEDLLEWRQ